MTSKTQEMRESTAGEVVLRAEQVSRNYHDGGRELTVLRGVDVSLSRGQSLAIIGPSGSGKSTLLGLLAGLDVPTSGRIEIAGQDIGQLSASDLAAHRGQHLGFVFQSYRLFPYATALENVCTPLELRRLPRAEILRRANDALLQVGLQERLNHRPSQLSGGEQQRVAIARALVTEPALLLADEPTGNLDQHSGAIIEDLLFDQCRQRGVALVVVTHDQKLAQRADHILTLREGVAVSADEQMAS